MFTIQRLWRASCCTVIIPLLLITFLGTFSGCTTTGTAGQFDPLPQAKVGAETLSPVASRSVTDLMRDAQKAFEAANAAQERGDKGEALDQYTLMLELMLEADLDPSIFYTLREPLGEVLQTSTELASKYEPRVPSVEIANDFEPSPGLQEIQVPFPLPERVLTQIEKTQAGRKKYFQASLNRSAKYLPYIREEMKKAGIPEELAWLASVESHFTPKINSRAGAGGMWQFMRPTGRRFNLRQDSLIDERYDWKKSTHAAIAYLKDLNEYFDGSWPLAITAYNMGENGLQRAISANGGDRNLWSLIETPPASYRIHRETKEYYPKFLATLIISNNPERYGFTYTPEAADNTVSVMVDGCYALSDLDASMGYPEGTLARLNPCLIREITPHTGEFSVSVPKSDRMKFQTALKNTKTLKYGDLLHTVRSGETISEIAGRYGVSQRELMQLNGIRSARSLQVNAKLRIPGFSGGLGGAGVTPSGDGVYAVRKNDTLYDIAKAHKIAVSDVQRWNSLGRKTRIYVGQKLYVADPNTPQTASAKSNPLSGEARYHTVKAGEYPAKIAKAYGVSLKDFLRWNNLTTKSTIQIGDRLLVGQGGGGISTAPTATPVASATAGKKAITHNVVKGDTAGGIAAKYGVRTNDVLGWNNLTKRSTLRIGQKLTIYQKDDSAPAEPIQTAAAQPTQIKHTVTKGQNPTSIARRYKVKVSDLQQWNGWSKNHVLHIGDKVIVHQ